MSYFVNPYYEIAIVGEKYKSRLSEFAAGYFPNILLMGGKDEGSLELLGQKFVPDKTLIYVCVNKSCQRPVQTVEEAIMLLKMNWEFVFIKNSGIYPVLHPLILFL